MAQPLHAPMANPVSVIGLRYCLPHPVDLAIIRKVMALTAGNFVVTDANDKIMFKVKVRKAALHDCRTLFDAAGNPIATLQQKIRTVHSRWQVFRGESRDRVDLLFSAKKSSCNQLKTELNVYLACNKSEEVCDFKVEGNWLERSCVIYAGESSTVVAQMHKKLTAEGISPGKDGFMVKVYPQIDYAFTAALLVIFDILNKEDGFN